MINQEPSRVSQILAQFAQSSGFTQHLQSLKKENTVVAVEEEKARTQIPKPMAISKSAQQLQRDRTSQLHESALKRECQSLDRKQQRSQESFIQNKEGMLQLPFNFNDKFLNEIANNQQYYQFLLYKINRKLVSGIFDFPVKNFVRLKRVELIQQALKISQVRAEEIKIKMEVRTNLGTKKDKLLKCFYNCISKKSFLILKLRRQERKLRDNALLQIQGYKFKFKTLKLIFSGWKKLTRARLILAQTDEQTNSQILKLRLNEFLLILRNSMRLRLKHAFLCLSISRKADQIPVIDLGKRWKLLCQKVRSSSMEEQIIPSDILNQSVFASAKKPLSQHCHNSLRKTSVKGTNKQFNSSSPELQDQYKLTPSQQISRPETRMSGQVSAFKVEQGVLQKIQKKKSNNINVVQNNCYKNPLLYKCFQALKRYTNRRRAFSQTKQFNRLKLLGKYFQALRSAVSPDEEELQTRRVRKKNEAAQFQDLQGLSTIEFGQNEKDQFYQFYQKSLMVKSFQILRGNSRNRNKSKKQVAQLDQARKNFTSRVFFAWKYQVQNTIQQRQKLLRFKLRLLQASRAKVFYYLKTSAQNAIIRRNSLFQLSRGIRETSLLVRSFVGLKQQWQNSHSLRPLEKKAQLLYDSKLLKKTFQRLRFGTKIQSQLKKKIREETSQASFQEQYLLLKNHFNLWKSYYIKQRTYRIFIWHYKNLRAQETKRKVLGLWKECMLKGRKESPVRAALSSHEQWLERYYERVLQFQQVFSQA